MSPSWSRTPRDRRGTRRLVVGRHSPGNDVQLTRRHFGRAYLRVMVISDPAIADDHANGQAIAPSGRDRKVHLVSARLPIRFSGSPCALKKVVLLKDLAGASPHMAVPEVQHHHFAWLHERPLVTVLRIGSSTVGPAREASPIRD